MRAPAGLMNVVAAELLNPEVSLWHNKDGAGITNTRQLQQASFKSAARITSQKKPLTQWLKPALKKDAALLTHIRATTSGKVCLDNTQPFTYGNLAFAHNGSLNMDWFTPIQQGVLADLPSEVVLQPDASDTKRTFATFVAELQHRCPQQKPTSEDIRQAFFDVCEYAFQHQPEDIVALAPDKTHIPTQGQLDWTGASNFILTHGQDIYALRHKLGLWYAPIKNRQGKITSTLIQSEPTQGLKDPTHPQKLLQWYEVPDDSLLHVKSGESGLQTLTLLPGRLLRKTAKPLAVAATQ